jgi:hypothetical protein
MSDQSKQASSYLQTVKPRHPHLRHIPAVQDNDSRTIHIKEAEYDASWKKRGGVGAFMMLARKWDRLENQDKAPWIPHERPLTEMIKNDEPFLPDTVVLPLRTGGVARLTRAQYEIYRTLDKQLREHIQGVDA